MKQVCYSKGQGGINEGVKSEHWEQFREFAGAILEKCPLPRESPIELCMILDLLGREHASILPEVRMKSELPTAETLAESSELSGSVRRRMIALQEELDWQCYSLYDLLDDDLRYDGGDLPEIVLGERAFEIVMARLMANGELETSWFERHRSKPITEVPSHWPDAYRSLVERRIRLIETNKEIGLIERPEYKHH